MPTTQSNCGNKQEIQCFIRKQILTNAQSFQFIMKSTILIFFVSFVMSFTPDAFSSALDGPWNEWKRSIVSGMRITDDEAPDIQVSLLCK